MVFGCLFVWKPYKSEQANSPHHGEGCGQEIFVSSFYGKKPKIFVFIFDVYYLCVW